MFANATPANANAAPVQFQSASLYVGDLHEEANEGILFELFNRVGPVASIRVCRDAVTRRSLGYAYVNFHNVQDAERALDTMNFSLIKEKACRIMWSQRDPGLRKSGVGNIFIKNLAPSVDHKALFDTFSVFGNILSCKVVTMKTNSAEEAAKGLGFGYVHYETGEAAQEAIKKFDGVSIDDVEVSVLPYVRRGDRAGVAEWTNLYVKHFPLSWSEAMLNELMAPHGTITSLCVMKDSEGKSKGFGFVNYADHASAEAALALGGKEIENDPAEVVEGEEPVEVFPLSLYVGQAQTKDKRLVLLKRHNDTAKLEKVAQTQGMNLYVKNLDDTITDDLFKQTFAAYGTITSCRLMKDAALNISLGFGYVCYSTVEEATRAVAELNGRQLLGKHLFVAVHQRKDQRRQLLQTSYAGRGGAGGGMMRGGWNGPQGGAMSGMLPMYGQQQRGFPMMQGPGGPMGGRGSPRYNNQGGGRGYPMPAYGMNGQGSPMGGRGPMQGGAMGGQGGRGPNNMMYQQRSPVGGMNQGQMRGPQGQMGGANRPMNQQQMQQGGNRGPQGQQMMMNQQQMMNQQGQQQGVKFNVQARNMPPQNMNNMNPQQQQMMMQQQQMMQQQAAPQMAAPSASEPLDELLLAQADPQAQKNMIGERLYPLIVDHQPQQAGKITGMLLEMDNAELLHLIESPDALVSKIEEALDVLKKHQTTD